MAALDTIITTLVGCVTTALGGTPAGLPDRICEVPGTLVWDACECGLAAITVDRIYPSNTFPDEAVDQVLVAPCPPVYDAYDLTVTVLRCAPTPGQGGAPPSCVAMDAATQTWIRDVEAVRRTIPCCLIGLRDGGLVEEWTLKGTFPTGPEGGCVGSYTQFTIGLINCACPTLAG